MERFLLTPRQTQVAVLVSRGFGYKDVARELGISHHTVRSLVVQITNKIPDDGRTALRRLMLWMLAEQEINNAALPKEPHDRYHAPRL